VNCLKKDTHTRDRFAITHNSKNAKAFQRPLRNSGLSNAPYLKERVLIKVIEKYRYL
jgi:hypothetical protein